MLAVGSLGSPAHALGDESGQAKEDSRGAGGHGVMLAAAGRQGHVWLCATRQTRPLGGSLLAWR